MAKEWAVHLFPGHVAVGEVEVVKRTAKFVFVEKATEWTGHSQRIALNDEGTFVDPDEGEVRDWAAKKLRQGADVLLKRAMRMNDAAEAVLRGFNDTSVD